MTDTATDLPDEVLELHDGSGPGSSRGLFRSLAGAQAYASVLHRHYLAQEQKLTPEERLDVEPVLPEMVWAVEQLYIDARHRIPRGLPRPVARYSDSGYFYVEKRTVHP